MARWSERASERLREGETVEATVPVGENGLVVTSQRVFAFVPAGEGANFRTVERPNVERVDAGSKSEPRWLGYVARGALGGLAGVGLGLTVDFGSLLDLGEVAGRGTSRVGMGGMLAVLKQISRLLGALDQVLLVGGLLALALALGAFGKYVESRVQTVQITVAGDDDLHVPASDRGDAVTQLRRHLDDGTGAIPADPLATEPDETGDRGTLGTIRDSLTADAPADAPDEGPAAFETVGSGDDEE